MVVIFCNLVPWKTLGLGFPKGKLMCLAKLSKILQGSVINWQLVGVLPHLKQRNSVWRRGITSAILESLEPEGYLFATYAGALNKQRNVTCLFKVEEKIRVSDLILTAGEWSIFAGVSETASWKVLIFCFY